MILRGRSIYANGQTAAKLARYLLHNPKNERVAYLGARGTAFPDDLEKSVDQMIWRAEKSKSQKPLYFTALSPDLDVDKTLTEEEWEIIRRTQARHLGLDGQPYAWVQHEKIGRDGQLRIHRHVVYQTYDAENEKMIPLDFDQRKNAQARAEIEDKLGHERTFQRWTLEEKQAQQLEAEGQAEQAAKLEKERQQQKMRDFLLTSHDIKQEPAPSEETPIQRSRNLYEDRKKQQEQEQTL